MYDISNKESFNSVEEVWQKEVDMYSTIADAVKIVVGNKCDKESERAVMKAEGMAFAKKNGCLFLECSAKARISVKEIFDELLQAIVETPSLLKDGPSGGRSRGNTRSVNLSEARDNNEGRSFVSRNCCS